MLHDNTPHFADLPGFPNHEYLPDRAVAAAKPMLVQVIEEAAALPGLVRHDGRVYISLQNGVFSWIQNSRNNGFDRACQVRYHFWCNLRYHLGCLIHVSECYEVHI